MIPIEMRKDMIDSNSGTRSICSQCELLNLSRSTLYYTPSKASEKDLAMMKALDNLSLLTD